MPYHNISTRWCPRYRGPLARLPEMEYPIAAIQINISICHISTITKPRFQDQKTSINCDLWYTEHHLRKVHNKCKMIKRQTYVISISKREESVAPFHLHYSWEKHMQARMDRRLIASNNLIKTGPIVLERQDLLLGWYKVISGGRPFQQGDITKTTLQWRSST